MRVHETGLFIVAMLVLLFTAASTHAADTDYEQLVRSALSEYDAGRYEEATALFNQAHALSPNARTHRGLGLTYFESRKYVLSAEHLRAALEDQRRPLTAKQRESASGVLKQAEGFIARVKISFEPDSATLEVDGHRAEIAGGELVLDPGKHELVARAAGHVDERRMLDVIAGSTSELRIALQPEQSQAPDAPLTAAGPTDATAGAAPGEAGKSGPGIAPWIVVGVGGALVVGGVITGIMASGVHSDLEKSCKDGCDAGFESDRDQGETLVTATNVLLIGGLVTAAVGVSWYLLASSDSEDSREPQVALGCLPTGCAASVRGAF